MVNMLSKTDFINPTIQGPNPNGFVKIGDKFRTSAPHSLQLVALGFASVLPDDAEMPPVSPAPVVSAITYAAMAPGAAAAKAEADRHAAAEAAIAAEQAAETKRQAAEAAELAAALAPGKK